MAGTKTLMDWLIDRAAWHDQIQEEVIEPEREIVDPHHHLWDRPDHRYELEALWDDTGSGHNVVQTVFVECRAYYDREAPEAFRPVGETRAVEAIADASAARPGAEIAAIVAHADLRHPDLDAALDAHAAASPRFRGIRHAGACDPEPEALMIPGRAPPGLYGDPSFRRGVARLGERGLSFDTWHYHHQNRDFADLARACPGTVMILDHFGGPLGVGRFAGTRDDRFTDWQRDMEAIAACDNVVAKLGGLAMPDNGFGWHERERPPGSDEFAEAQAPYYHHMISVFGPDRCMFEANYPVDKVSISYRVLWNGLKKMAGEYPEDAQSALFSGTARRVYRLTAW